MRKGKIALGRLSNGRCVSVAIVAALLSLSSGWVNAALEVDALVYQDPARPGELLQVEFTIANTDPFLRSGVTLEVVRPAGVNQLFETDFSGDCPGTACEEGETIVWTLGTLPAGGFVTVDLPVIVSNGTASGTEIDFVADASDDFGGAATESASVTVQGTSRYDLGMAENADPAQPGEALTYKIAWGFRADAVGVAQSELTFPLPAGATFVAATEGGSSDGTTVAWPLGFLLPGDSGIREVTVALDGGLATPSVLGAQAQLTNLGNPGEDATARTDTVISASRPLSVAVEQGIEPARQGEDAHTLLIVTNNDAFTRFGVTLTGRVPQDNNQLFESGIFDGQCTGTACESAELVTWTLGDLPAGASTSVSLPPRIPNAAVDGVLVNYFFTARDSLGTQTTQADILRIQGNSPFDIALAENADPATAGSQLVYRVHFGYREDAGSVANSTLRFALPEGTSFVSATDSGAESGGVVTWPLGVLSPGDGGIRDVTVTIDSGLTLPSVLEAYAEVFDNASPVERARGEAATVVAASRPLDMAIETNTQPAFPGEMTHTQLTVTNNQAFARFGVTLVVRHPQDVAQLFETTFDGDCVANACEANETITWLLGDIPGGGAVTVDLPEDIANAAADGVLINLRAVAEDDQGVQTRAMSTIRVQSDGVFDVSLSESADPALAGDSMQYQVTYGYRSEAVAVANSRLRLVLPDGVTFVSASDGGSATGNVVTWDLGILSPGDGGLRTVQASIDAGLPAGTVLQAEAVAESLTTPLEQSRSQATTVIASAIALSIAVEANPKPARSGEQGNVDITVTNNGPITRFGVVLRGRHAENVFQLFESAFEGDCDGTACESNEIVSWLLGDVPAGGSVTVEWPARIANSTTEGSLINFYLQARDDQAAQARYVDTIRVQNDPLYEVLVAETANPAMAGQTLVYRVTYGYREDAALVSDSMLELILPDGVTPMSALGGGAISGNTVSWSLAFLSQGDGGLRVVTAQVQSGVPAGTTLEAVAHVYSVNDPIEAARSETVTAVAQDSPLRLTMGACPSPAQAGEGVLYELAVTNDDAVTRFGVTLVARMPQDVGQLFEGSWGGDCPGTACEFGELITWTLGDMAAGQTINVTMPGVIANATLDGVLVSLYAYVRDDTLATARQVRTARIGPAEPLDIDGDGVLDEVDNCVLAANCRQTDTDGDGYGNQCDADLDNSCSVNFGDLAAFKSVFFPAPYDPEADFNSDGFVNFGDLAIFKSRFLMPIGPSADPDAFCP